MTTPTVYTCITNAYDALAPVNGDWNCHFIAFHDGTIAVPEGWEGRELKIPGVAGIDLNRYAKMLPHRLDLPSDRSTYVDGNLLFKQDPAPWIDALLETRRFAAMPHPDRDCVYAELRHAMKIGFVGPTAAWRSARQLRRSGVPRHSGLFEAGALFRRHAEPDVIRLGEQWWTLWQEGLRRDQPLLVRASRDVHVPVNALEQNAMRDEKDPWIALHGHKMKRSRWSRLPNRLAAELMLFRCWLPR